MNEPAVSIIVPVYNVEKYLPQCIDSVLVQTFTDWELLLIDDGSPDRSGQICDEYAARDSRIRVFHKPNGGVSSARQKGLSEAKGSYAIHLDPDDWIESKTLSDLLKKALTDNVDMVIFDMICHNGNNTHVLKQCPTELSSNIVMLDLFKHLHGSCCNKLISKRFYSKATFPKAINICEDLLYIVQILFLSPKISYIPYGYYHYNINSYDNSQSKIMAADRFYQLCNVLSKLEVISTNNPQLKETIYKKHIPYTAYVGIKSLDLTSKDFRKFIKGSYITHCSQANLYVLNYSYV